MAGGYDIQAMLQILVNSGVPIDQAIEYLTSTSPYVAQRNLLGLPGFDAVSPGLANGTVESTIGMDNAQLLEDEFNRFAGDGPSFDPTPQEANFLASPDEKARAASAKEDEDQTRFEEILSDLIASGAGQEEISAFIARYWSIYPNSIGTASPENMLDQGTGMMVPTGDATGLNRVYYSTPQEDSVLDDLGDSYNNQIYMAQNGYDRPTSNVPITRSTTPAPQRLPSPNYPDMRSPSGFERLLGNVGTSADQGLGRPQRGVDPYHFSVNTYPSQFTNGPFGMLEEIGMSTYIPTAMDPSRDPFWDGGQSSLSGTASAPFSSSGATHTGESDANDILAYLLEKAIAAGRPTQGLEQALDAQNQPTQRQTPHPPPGRRPQPMTKGHYPPQQPQGKHLTAATQVRSAALKSNPTPTRARTVVAPKPAPKPVYRPPAVIAKPAYRPPVASKPTTTRVSNLAKAMR
jgi:hypothetical protein